MTRTILGGLMAALVGAAFPAAVGAQEAAPQLEQDPRAPRFREVERGFFATAEAGFLGITKTPVADPVSHPYVCPNLQPGQTCAGGGFASGLALSLDLGYDFSSRFAASAFMLQGFQSASRSYGSFSLTSAGLGARWSFATFADANEVERLRLFLRARGGYVWTYPAGLFGTTDWLAGVGFGVDYDTRLRHFAIGLVVDGLYFLQVKVPAFDVMATLRYTF
jgi:hypothetical protein